MPLSRLFHYKLLFLALLYASFALITGANSNKLEPSAPPVAAVRVIRRKIEAADQIERHSLFLSTAFDFALSDVSNAGFAFRQQREFALIRNRRTH